jgi:hypothetical protein
MYKIQWSHHTEEEATWETVKGYEVGYASDKQKFPPHKLGKLLL